MQADCVQLGINCDSCYSSITYQFFDYVQRVCQTFGWLSFGTILVSISLCVLKLGWAKMSVTSATTLQCFHPNACFCFGPCPHCRMIIGLSVTLGLFLFELIGFMGGITMFFPFQSLLCILRCRTCHSRQLAHYNTITHEPLKELTLLFLFAFFQEVEGIKTKTQSQWLFRMPCWFWL